MRKVLFIISVFLFMLLVALYIVFKPVTNISPKKTSAQSSASSITSQAQWQGGTNSSLLDTTTLAGSIKINTSGGITQVDTSGATVSAEVDGGNAPKIIDGNDATGWGFGSVVEGECHWWKMDLGSVVVGITRVTNVGGGEADSTQEVLFSQDDSSYSSVTTFAGAGGPFTYNLPVSQDVRYVKINACNAFLFGPGDNVGENELRLYQGPFAATNKENIDGSESGTKNFIEWETFTPTYSEPANTNVKFRFRTSADAVTWTSWSAYQTPASGNALDISAVVDSGSGANKYLQVETTLENTDGASTPTIDAYDITYHTNTKPNKPTASSATVQ